MRVTLKQSKTNPFQRDIDLYLGATGATTCPIKGILRTIPHLVRQPQGTSLHLGGQKILHTPMPQFLTQYLTNHTEKLIAGSTTPTASALGHLPLQEKQYPGCPHSTDGEMEKQHLPNLY